MPYPIQPGPRIAYDIDGSIGLIRFDDRVVHDIHPIGLKALNCDRAPGMGFPAENYAGWSDVNDECFIALSFPAPMRVQGIWGNLLSYTSVLPATNIQVEASPNSTNGVDGTWSTLCPLTYIPAGPNAPAGVGNDGKPINSLPSMVVNDRYKRDIIAVSGPATRQVRMIRLKGRARANYPFTGAAYLHVYGTPDTSAVGKRLAFWQVSLDQVTDGSWFDWGDTPSGSSADKVFRVKNTSSDAAAHGIIIDAVSGSTPTEPSPDGFLLFSLDGGSTWAPTVTIATLSPLAVSGTIRVRRTVPTNATLSNWGPRIIADAGSWV